MTSMNTFGLIGLTEENVGIDRRFYTGLTSTNGTFAVSYNAGRVDVFLNGIKLVGNHTGNTNYDYTMDATTGTGSSITLATGVALVSADVVECIGYVSNSSNTITSYNPTPASGDGGWNVFININHTASDLVNVFLNGVLLDDSDYTLDASNNKVTIGGATLTASDVVVIQVIGALDHSNFVPAGGGTFSGNVSFGDNNKAQFGAGNDLQIYHDGSNSYVEDAGTGRLYLRGNDRVQIQKYDGSTGEDMVTASVDDGVKLYYDNSKKFETTATGVEVTGNVKLSASGGIDFSNASGSNSGSTSALLDDYEEGSVSQPVAIGSAHDNNTTHTGSFYRNTSCYTKIGNRVIYTVSFDTFSQSMPTTGSIWINLPFNVTSNEYHLNRTVMYINSTWYQVVSQLFEGNTGKAIFYNEDYNTAMNISSNSHRIIVNTTFSYTTSS